MYTQKIKNESTDQQEFGKGLSLCRFHVLSTQRIFPDERSCLRLVATLSMEQSEDRGERRYLDMSLLAEWSPLDDELSRGVLKMTEGLGEASLAGQLSSLVAAWPFDEPVPAGEPKA